MPIRYPYFIAMYYPNVNGTILKFALTGLNEWIRPWFSLWRFNIIWSLVFVSNSALSYLLRFIDFTSIFLIATFCLLLSYLRLVCELKTMLTCVVCVCLCFRFTYWLKLKKILVFPIECSQCTLPVKQWSNSKSP